MSSEPIRARPCETNLPIVAMFTGNEAALAAIDRLGLHLLRLPAPGIALIAPVSGCRSKLYAQGAWLVVD